MPEFRTQFSQEQLAKVANYVSTSFGNPQHPITSVDVSQTLQGESGSWLIRYAQPLTIAGSVVAVMVLLWLIYLLRRRRG
jgi:hypothetical protein